MATSKEKILEVLDGLIKKYENTPNSASIPLNYRTIKDLRAALDETASSTIGGDIAAWPGGYVDFLSYPPGEEIFDEPIIQKMLEDISTSPKLSSYEGMIATLPKPVKYVEVEFDALVDADFNLRLDSNSRGVTMGYVDFYVDGEFNARVYVHYNIYTSADFEFKAGQHIKAIAYITTQDTWFKEVGRFVGAGEVENMKATLFLTQKGDFRPQMVNVFKDSTYLEEVTIVKNYEPSRRTSSLYIEEAWSGCFANCSALTTIKGLEQFDGFWEINFLNCTSLTSLPVSYDKILGYVSSPYSGTNLPWPFADGNVTLEQSTIYNPFLGLTNVPATLNLTLPNVRSSNGFQSPVLFQTWSGATDVTVNYSNGIINLVGGNVYSGATGDTILESLTVNGLGNYPSGTMYLNNNTSLTSLLTPGLIANRVYAYSNNLDAAAINAFFTSLGTVPGGQTATVYVYSNPGAATCDQTIATNKGWTVSA